MFTAESNNDNIFSCDPTTVVSRYNITIEEPETEANQRQPLLAQHSSTSSRSLYSRAYPFIASAGAATAFNGMENFLAEYPFIKNLPPEAKLIISLIPWIAQAIMFVKTNPDNSINTTMLSALKGWQEKASIYSSWGAGLCSGFLATATTYKFTRYIHQIINHDKDDFDPDDWLKTTCIATGVVLFLICNTISSLNMGRFATDKFVIFWRKINSQLPHYSIGNKVCAGVAGVSSLLVNIFAGLPYCDGIADGMAGVIAGGDKKLLNHLYYLCVGQYNAENNPHGVTVSDESAFHKIYWSIFMIAAVVNTVSLCTFTMGPSYELFYSTLTTLFRCQKSPELWITRQYRSQPSYCRQFEAGSYALLMGLLYMMVFIGFIFDTLHSSKIGTVITDAIPPLASTTTQLELSAFCGVTTWGPTLLTDYYSNMLPQSENYNPYYMSILDHLLFLKHYLLQNAITRSAAINNFYIVIASNKGSYIAQKTMRSGPEQNQPTWTWTIIAPLYRTEDAEYTLTTEPHPTPQPSLHDLIELMGIVFSAQRLKYCIAAGKRSPGFISIEPEEKVFTIHGQTISFYASAAYNHGHHCRLFLNLCAESVTSRLLAQASNSIA